MSKERQSTKVRKKAMIAALEASLGIVTKACESVGMVRNTHYDWMRDDPEYKQAVESVQDMAIDYAESALFNQIGSGNATSTIFFLKCRGRDRGYVDKQEIDMSVKEVPSININLMGGKDD